MNAMKSAFVQGSKFDFYWQMFKFSYSFKVIRLYKFPKRAKIGFSVTLIQFNYRLILFVSEPFNSPLKEAHLNTFLKTGSI